MNESQYKIFKTLIKPLRNYKLSQRFPINYAYNYILPRITPEITKVVEVNGYKLQVSCGNHSADGVGQLLIFEHEYDKTTTRLIKETVSNNMRVIDIGANIGYYTMLLASLVGNNGHVCAIEPEQNNYDRLSYNININSYDNIVPLALAAGHENKIVKLYASHVSSGRNNLIEHRDNGHTVEVPMMTLDSIVKECTQIDFVKCDAEGYDLNVMIGAKRVIQESPNIKWLMEIWLHGLGKLGQSLHDIIDLVKEHKFQTALMVNNITNSIDIVDIDQPYNLIKYLERHNHANVLFSK